MSDIPIDEAGGSEEFALPQADQGKLVSTQSGAGFWPGKGGVGSGVLALAGCLVGAALGRQIQARMFRPATDIFGTCGTRAALLLGAAFSLPVVDQNFGFAKTCVV